VGGISGAVHGNNAKRDPDKHEGQTKEKRGEEFRPTTAFRSSKKKGGNRAQSAMGGRVSVSSCAQKRKEKIPGIRSSDRQVYTCNLCAVKEIFRSQKEGPPLLKIRQAD